jgi:IS1 family transposase
MLKTLSEKSSQNCHLVLGIKNKIFGNRKSEVLSSLSKKFLKSLKNHLNMTNNYAKYDSIIFSDRHNK